MRALIIKTSAADDIIHALPLLDYLQQAVAGIEIDWVVEEPFLQLLARNPLLSKIHVVRTPFWRKRPFASSTWREVAQVRQALQERDYDLVFDIQGSLESGVICKLSGCPDCIGFDRDELQGPLNSLFTTRRIPVRRQDYHVTDRYLRLVSVPFARDFRQMSLASGIQTSPEEDADAEALLATLSDGLVFLFQYGATCQTRFWSMENWIGLGKEVLERFSDATILLPWDDDSERAAAASIAAGIGKGCRVLDRYTLKGLAALMKKVDLVVGGDSVPVHLAAAVGTPTVSFYRSSDGKRSGPRGDHHVVIQSPMHCARCFRSRCDKDDHCRETVKVEAVFAGIERLLFPGN